MMENHDVSIDDVRALVAERQRYDDWLAGLEARRDETPQRVFDRVQGDYQVRREVVLAQLRDHVESLKSMKMEFSSRLDELDAKLATLEDERAEAMLRTAVGEFDNDHWEKVRADVEAQIEDFGGQRSSLQDEITDVSALLKSADTPLMVEAIEDEDGPVANDAPVADEALTISLDGMVDDQIASHHTDTTLSDAARPNLDGMMMVSVEVNSTSALDISDDMLIHDVSTIANGKAAGIDDGTTTDDEDNADIDDALSMFSSADDADAFTDGGAAPKLDALDGITGFDESRDRSTANRERTSTATVTPQASSTVSSANSGEKAGSSDSAKDGFDDLAFLRSVVDPSAQSGSTRSSGQSEQQKTLRCTECSTMNLPTEWYCERCGGELAAF